MRLSSSRVLLACCSPARWLICASASDACECCVMCHNFLARQEASLTALLACGSAMSLSLSPGAALAAAAPWQRRPPLRVQRLTAEVTAGA